VPGGANVRQAAGARAGRVGGTVVVIARLAKVAADAVGNAQRVERRVVGEQPAVVGVKPQGRVPPVDRLEQAAKVFPNGPRVVGVAVFVGFANGLGGGAARDLR